MPATGAGRHETNIPGAATGVGVSGFPVSSMCVNPAVAVHSAVHPAVGLLSTLLTGLAFFACLGAAEGLAADPVRQPTPIQFSFDRPIDASAAPFVLAAADGLFGAEGLAVTTNIASGSPDAIARVAAGTSDLALVDINALIRFRDKSDAPPVKAVFVLFNKSPYAIIARKSRGIHALSDIEGKTLGVAEGDLSIRLWPALARQNGIKIATVKQEHDRRRRARADAVGRSGRCRDRIFLSVGGQFAGIAAFLPTTSRCFDTPIMAARPMGSLSSSIRHSRRRSPRR